MGDMNEKEVAESYYHEIKKLSFLRLAARNINYLIDVGYRLLFSFIYQLQGKTVLFDRHFLFNSAPDYGKNGKQKQHVLDAALYWIFKTLYPKPDLVIFLDAPTDILLSRKNEVSKDYLERRRNAIIAQGNITSNFKRVDASQSLHQVEILVSQEIENLYRELDNQ